MSELESYRKEIDIIDKEILSLLKQRLAVAEKIGEFKRLNKLQVFQPDREQVILEDKTAKAIEMGLDPVYIRKIYELMIQYARDLQRKASI